MESALTDEHRTGATPYAAMPTAWFLDARGIKKLTDYCQM